MIEHLRASRTAVCAVLVTAVLPACSAGTERAAAPSPEPSVPTAGPSPTPSVSAAAPSAAAAVRTLTFSYAGGEVTGDTGRQAVRLGERVVLRVTSDVAEEVHVHGYDVSQVVPAGGTVDVALTASLPGGFEVELHEAGTALCQLRVA